MRRIASVLGFLALGLNGRAAADPTVQFDQLCTTGSFQVCASVHVTLLNSTTLRMRVWNLEGLMGERSTLTAIGLFHSSPGSGFSGTATLSSVEYVTSGGSTTVTTDWKATANDIKTLGSVDVELASGTAKGHKGGIVGCSDPGPASADHRATCASWPDVPYVDFTFTLSGDSWDLNDTELRFHAQQLGDNLEGSIKCDTMMPDGTEHHCGVAPEPITLTLVGTGLAGIAGTGWLRRRRRKPGIGEA